MYSKLRMVAVALVTAGVLLAAPKPAFEVATIKLSAPIDAVKMAAAMRAGQMPKFGAHIEGGRAEFLYMSLRDLISYAWKMKSYQITAPEWAATQRFDILAKLPEGAVKADANGMLKTLLEERFALKTHLSKTEQPVLGLVVGKGGPKMQASSEKPKPIDETIPLRAGESSTEGPDGQMRMLINPDGSASVNMGERGMMTYKVDRASMNIQLGGSMITMAGLAEMLSQFSQSAGTRGKQVVDMTGLTGVYQVSVEFSLAELIQMAKATGMELPGDIAKAVGENASDPGSSSMVSSIQAMGLKLESRKAMLDELVIDHAEKTPTEN